MIPPTAGGPVPANRRRRALNKADYRPGEDDVMDADHFLIIYVNDLLVQDIPNQGQIVFAAFFYENGRMPARPSGAKHRRWPAPGQRPDARILCL